jgi:two-component system nitrate/nitrite response regulator NarL
LIRACIVSDVRLYRDGLAEILAGQRQIAVVASLAYGEGDLAAAEQVQPEVVLLDVAGPEGEAALRRFVGRLPEAHFVALTVSDSEAQIVACAEAGVEGFVTRTSSLTELVAAVESASHGESACSPRIAAVLLRRVQTLSRGRPRTGPAKRLTPRENEVLELVSAGLSNKQIARQLSIELSTVKNHMHNILEKLGVHQRTDAAAVLGDRNAEMWRRRNGERI